MDVAFAFDIPAKGVSGYYGDIVRPGKVMEIHDYNVVMTERENGIRAMVSAMKKRSFGQDDISQMLIEEYGLAPEIAASKVREYWE